MLKKLKMRILLSDKILFYEKDFHSFFVLQILFVFLFLFFFNHQQICAKYPTTITPQIATQLLCS